MLILIFGRPFDGVGDGFSGVFWAATGATFACWVAISVVGTGTGVCINVGTGTGVCIDVGASAGAGASFGGGCDTLGGAWLAGWLAGKL